MEIRSQSVVDAEFNYQNMKRLVDKCLRVIWSKINVDYTHFISSDTKHNSCQLVCCMQKLLCFDEYESLYKKCHFDVKNALYFLLGISARLDILVSQISSLLISWKKNIVYELSGYLLPPQRTQVAYFWREWVCEPCLHSYHCLTSTASGLLFFL